MTIANESGGIIPPWMKPHRPTLDETLEPIPQENGARVSSTYSSTNVDPGRADPVAWPPGMIARDWREVRKMKEREDGAREGVAAWPPGQALKDWREVTWERRLAQVESERDSARVEHDESRAAQRSIICELQQAMSDVFRHLGPPTDRHAPWREQVIAGIDAVRADLDKARAELAASAILIDTLRQDVAKAVAHGEGVRAELAVARLLTKRWLALQGWMGDGHDEEEEACMKSARAFLSDGGGQ